MGRRMASTQMWNPRLYGLVVCVGLVARGLYRGVLRELNGDFGGMTALIAFWIPLGWRHLPWSGIVGAVD